MRRRRFRIAQLMEDSQVKAATMQAESSQVPQNQAATVQTAETVTPSWLNPSQRRILDLQQQSGNQSAQRALGLIQRAAPTAEKKGDDKKDEKEQDDKLSEALNSSALQGVDDKQDNPSILATAITAYKSKKYGIALVAFRELVHQTNHPRMLLNMAICELRLDMFKEAERDLTMAMQTEELNEGDYSRAISALDASRKLQNAGSVGFVSLPSNVDTEESPLAKDPRAIRHQIESLYRTAESAAKSEDYEGSLNAFRLAQSRLPNPITQINIGKTLVMLQRYGEAADAFNKAKSNRALGSGHRKIVEAEIEATKHFQGKQLDGMGDLPRDD